ncbi:MAG: hypothetical protein ACOVQ4_14630 [Flectobacillus sp.]
MLLGCQLYAVGYRHLTIVFAFAGAGFLRWCWIPIQHPFFPRIPILVVETSHVSSTDDYLNRNLIVRRSSATSLRWIHSLVLDSYPAPIFSKDSYPCRRDLTCIVYR